MNADIVSRDQFWILGRQETFTDENEDHEGLWNRYMACHDQVAQLSTDGAFYEAYFDADVGAERALDCLAGIAVAAGCRVPPGFTLRSVPESTYAVFECTVKTIPETWGRIFGEWLKAANFQANPEGANFDYHPSSCDGESAVRLYLAVEQKAD